MLDICLDEAFLLLNRGVALNAACERCVWVVVVVRPLGEVVRKLATRKVGRGVLEVDDDELLVLVLGLQKRGLLVICANTEDVAVLCLEIRE